MGKGSLVSSCGPVACLSRILNGIVLSVGLCGQGDPSLSKFKLCFVWNPGDLRVLVLETFYPECRDGREGCVFRLFACTKSPVWSQTRDGFKKVC